MQKALAGGMNMKESNIGDTKRQRKIEKFLATKI